MSGQYDEASAMPRQVDEALRVLLEKHFGVYGVVLTPEQLNGILQQDPVPTFLRGMLDLARREQQASLEVVDLNHTTLAASMPAAPAATAQCERYPLPAFDTQDPDVPELALPASAVALFAGLEASAGSSKAIAEGDAARSLPSISPPAPPTSPVAALVAPVSSEPQGPEQEKGVASLLLQLPNATAQAPYTHFVHLDRKPELAAYRIVSITGLDGTGLEYADEGRLRGTPQTERTKTTELKFTALLERADGAKRLQRTATLVLLVNPDPRALWKSIDPDPALPFQKVHRRCASHGLGNQRCVAASIRGRSHANSGAFREDDFHIADDASGNWLVVAVSDGAGSAKLSRRGSELATNTAVEALCKSLPTVEEKFLAMMTTQADEATRRQAIDALFLEPLGRAAFAASKAIVAEAKQLQVEEKALSSTLLLAAVRRYEQSVVVVSYWIGDGAAAVFEPASSRVTLLGEPDSGEFSGQTRFLQSAEFGADPWASIKRRVRTGIHAPGSALVLMTDGVSDPKFGTDNALKDSVEWGGWWKTLTATVTLAQETVGAPEAMESYLDFWSQGEHDDRTLAIVY
jgi:serine/threonine protein phosphatase PrpC